MVRPYSRLKIADNSGVKEIQVIRVIGNLQDDALNPNVKIWGTVGDIVVGSVKAVIPNSQYEVGDVVKAVIVRTAKEVRRDDGSYVKFDDNAAVVITNDFQVKGTRVFGPVARELRKKGFARIVSLAPEVI
ncbi:50S ribosomal protein L14 [bacterium 3DAC]|jgi:large subunit ribosomal protein L14|nr:50S ribosomal protein L14 [Dictyoglomota bacterium]UZN23319.1 50S ribosomal protein L14 [bacterium 3DAC]